MQEIEVKLIRLQPSQAALARCNRAAACGVLRQNFADQKYLVTPPGDCLRHHFFGAAIRIHFSGVDQLHTELNTQAKRRNFFLSSVRIRPHGPGALAQHGHALSGREISNGNRLRHI
jgi:hypothetical protein